MGSSRSSSSDARIVGGEEAEEDRYPYVVSMVNKTGHHFCAGTLVHPLWVMTAAHCCKGRASHVVLGHHNLTNTTLYDYVDAERIKVMYEYRHPQYRPRWVIRYDVALVRLWEPVISVDTVTLRRPDDANSSVAPHQKNHWLIEWFEQSMFWFPVSGTQLCRDDEVEAGTNVTAIGWGKTVDAENETVSDVLKELDFTVVGREECNAIIDARLGFFDRLLYDVVNDGSLCTIPVVNRNESVNEEEDVDGYDKEENEYASGLCNGDSGGPTFIKGSNASEDVQVGIASWVIGGCGDPDVPDVNTDVSYYVDFVDEVTERNDTLECDFPDDGFAYDGCNVPNPCWLNDDVCDGGEYNTSECRYDGIDCAYCEFPDDGFDYGGCDAYAPCRLGDGICDEGTYQTAACNYDAGDCCTSIGFLGFHVYFCNFERMFSLFSLLR